MPCPRSAASSSWPRPRSAAWAHRTRSPPWWRSSAPTPPRTSPARSCRSTAGSAWAAELSPTHDHRKDHKTMDRSTAFDALRKAAVEVLSVEPDQVTEEASFADDLDAD